jgi:hypothetical protein
MEYKEPNQSNDVDCCDFIIKTALGKLRDKMPSFDLKKNNEKELDRNRDPIHNTSFINGAQ